MMWCLERATGGESSERNVTEGRQDVGMDFIRPAAVSG